jgi:hypothetical protein
MLKIFNVPHIFLVEVDPGIFQTLGSVFIYQQQFPSEGK